MRDTTIEKILGFLLDMIILIVLVPISLVEMVRNKCLGHYSCWGCERKSCYACMTDARVRVSCVD